MAHDRGRRRAACRALALALAGLAWCSAPAAAQLLSPGKLSAPHSRLEGMSNCASCHELGKPRASEAKCLDCHKLLAQRIAARKGLHATYEGKNCAQCHKEHFGTDFTLVRFDTTGFDHKTAGFELKLAHGKVACRACHKDANVAAADVRQYAAEHKTLDRTFLGLGTGCLDCHRKDDDHAGQFATRGCRDCHTEETWKKAPGFNHDSTAYALTGRHVQVECTKCHRPAPGAGPRPMIRFAGVTHALCTDCHRDPHRGAMRRACTECHTTADWKRLLDRSKFEATFDHGTTKFALKGAHAKATCARCHDTRATRPASLALKYPARAGGAGMYPAPEAGNCQSCHTDYHQSVFAKSPGGALCSGCHTETAWLPTSFDLARHNQQTWKLTGAHVAVPCLGCHTAAGGAKAPPRFRLDAEACVTCHKADDPHAGQFTDRKCDDCHTTAAFRITGFDHSRTKYPLDGAHQKVPCAGCHATVTAPDGKRFVRYRPLESTCRACHGATIKGTP